MHQSMRWSRSANRRDVAHAIDRVAFVAGQQHRQRAGVIGMRGDELLGGTTNAATLPFMSAPRPPTRHRGSAA